LTAKDIRLQYSGFVIFAAKMVSVVSGLIFQFIVARALNEVEYGLWFNINDITTYFVLMAGVLPFWTMRFVARNKDGAIKTGIFANLTISAVASLVYILLVPLITSALGISGEYLPTYFLISIQIIELHSIGALEACLQAKIPQTVGYGLLVQQACRVILGYVLIVMFNQLLFGAVATTIVAFALQISYYFKLLASELQKRIRFEYIIEWLKGSLANIYNVVGNQIAAYIFIMLFMYGGEEARGIFGAATIVVNVITYSSFLAYALTPMLLAEKKHEDVRTSLRMVLMFAIPMTAGAVALSDSYMTLLRTDIIGAGPVLVVLALDAFIMVVSGLYTMVLYGVETVDEGARLSLRQLARSRLFIAFSLPYLHSAITLPTAYYVLTGYAQDQPVHAAFYVSIINASVRSAMFLILYIVVRKMIKIEIPWGNIAKYVFAATVMGGLLYIIPHPTRISVTLLETVIGGAVYLAILMAIDKEARTLPSLVMKEIRQKPK
jgi:O-antigen/teichoic acid export membrane protein